LWTVLLAADDANGTISNLQAKVEQFESVAEREQSRLISTLDRAQKTSQRKGDLETVKAIAAELEAFRATGRLPSIVSTRSYVATMRRAVLKLDADFASAVAASTKDGDIETAEWIQQRSKKLRHLTDEVFSGKPVMAVSAPVSPLANGTLSQSNRTYRWFNVPEELRGKAFTVLPGGAQQSLSIQVKTPGDMFIAAHDPTKADITVLENLGARESDLSFNFTNKSNSAVTVFRLVVRESFTLPASESWTGFVVIY
jgi:hypothetical protein